MTGIRRRSSFAGEGGIAPIRTHAPTFRALLGLLALSTLAPTVVHGQAKQDSVLLRGRVVEEESGEPIAFVGLRIMDRDLRFVGQTETDRDGRFAHVVRKKAGVYIHLKRIGYQDNDTPFLWFERHDHFDLEIRMDREAVLLAPLEVLARRQAESPVLADFRHRTQLGMGSYLTRDQIQARHPSRVTDLLSEIPGVRLSSSGLGLRRVVEMARGGASAGSCPVQVYLDGMHLNENEGPPSLRAVAIDDYVSPESVLGIEVYRGLSTVPPEFLNEYAKCGVVALWTLRGGSG